uniref:Uncharacterized protein n=1 Tax=Taeniopygia guttata TaxID=59729 RepID=A0A674G835_TAEGU
MDTMTWMVPGAEGEGYRHQRGRGDGQAQLALLAPRVSAHHPGPGHRSTGAAGHMEQPSLPCCSAAPVVLLRVARSPRQGPQGTHWSPSTSPAPRPPALPTH